MDEGWLMFITLHQNFESDISIYYFVMIGIEMIDK